MVVWVWGLGVGDLGWVFRVGVFSLWGLRFGACDVGPSGFFMLQLSI